MNEPIHEGPSGRGSILLIDGHAFAYRAFFAIRNLSSPQGAPTNAIYGFIQMIRRLRDRLQPVGCLVLWDGGLSPERVKSLPNYKANRPEMPGDLAVQFDEINKYLDAVGIRWLIRDGVEADDLIATLARHYEKQGHLTVIASSDKDFMQLVSDSVLLSNPGDKSGELWGADKVRSKTGVAPAQIVDWLSLIGDSADNIQGVPGVGPKIAASLLGKFGNIDQLYRDLDQVENERIRALLAASKEVVDRNRRLILLDDKIAIDDLDGLLAVRPPDAQRLQGLLKGWGFRGSEQLAEASPDQQPDFQFN